MAERNLILDSGHNLAYEEILTYMNEPALSRWTSLNSFIQDNYKVKPKITFSKCSMQRGWNVKYQKSGKSLCTLYPEKDTFTALIVIKMELAEIITAMYDRFDKTILNIIQSSRPFNGTKWLMISVENEVILNNVQLLLTLKCDTSRVNSKR